MRAAIIEDQATIRVLLTELLRAEGFDADGYEDQVSYRSACAEPSELYVVDWNLPEDTAEVFVKELLDESPTAHCLVVSGCSVSFDSFPSSHLSRMAFLEKPFTASMLRNAIAALLAAV